MNKLEHFLSRHIQIFFSIARIIIGFLFLSHGAQKLFSAFGGHGTYGNTKLFIAGIIEFLCGILFGFGFKTRFVAFIAAVEMLYAYLSVHQPQGLWPIQNGGEMALLYFCFFLFSIANGGGEWSLDALFMKKD
jgi:putative oxidoreductase